MISSGDKFQRSAQACVENARKLLEDAEWSTNQASTGLALAMLAQEECAKAFVLALVRDEILPWTEDVRRSLSVHECKHLVVVIMEWLCSVNELRLNERFSQAVSSQITPVPPQLPSDVATAMNIFRHEMIEGIGRRSRERYSDWRGFARKVADGQRDRKKQEALYVGIGKDGDVRSLPPSSVETFTAELAHGKALVEFAEDVGRRCIFAYREYELFAEVFSTMFKDLASEGQGNTAPGEVIPSGIPGIVFVRRSITVANVVSTEPTERDDPPDNSDD
jgi:AbiV family abortive infection protein